MRLISSHAYLYKNRTENQYDTDKLHSRARLEPNPLPPKATK